MAFPPIIEKGPGVKAGSAAKTWPGTKVVGLAAFVFCFALVWPPLAPGTGGEESMQKIIQLAACIAGAGLVFNIFYYILRVRNRSGAARVWPGTICIGLGLVLAQIGFLGFMFQDSKNSPFAEGLFIFFMLGALLLPIGLMVNGVYAVAVKNHRLRETLLWFSLYLAWVYANQTYPFLRGLESLLLLYSGAGLLTHLVLRVMNYFQTKPSLGHLA